jgi:oligopeptide transport system permease protein
MTDIPGTNAHMQQVKSRSLFQLAALRFRRNKAAMAGAPNRGSPRAW